jgi:hypothetical protein
MLEWSSTSRPRLVESDGKTIFLLSTQTMTRRTFQLRDLNRLNVPGAAAPQGRPPEPSNALQCTQQELTWEELLGRR